MIIQDEVDKVVNNSNYVKHFLEVKNTKDNFKIVTIEYWTSVGSTLCLRWLKQYVVKDYQLPTEQAWRDIGIATSMSWIRGL